MQQGQPCFVGCIGLPRVQGFRARDVQVFGPGVTGDGVLAVVVRATVLPVFGRGSRAVSAATDSSSSSSGNGSLPGPRCDDRRCLQRPEVQRGHALGRTVRSA